MLWLLVKDRPGHGLRAEPALIGAVVSDMQEAPGALPLMSTALVEVWQHRAGDTLTAAAYHHAGGVSGALARLGEAALARLDEPARAAARRILLRLADTGDGGPAASARGRASPPGSLGRMEAGGVHDGQPPSRERGRAGLGSRHPDHRLEQVHAEPERPFVDIEGRVVMRGGVVRADDDVGRSAAT